MIDEAAGDVRVLVTLAAPDVFEAVSPLLADVDGDGVVEVVATVANGNTGARVVAYSLADGAVVAETPAIGRGNRWRNQLAIAPVGPGGEVELIDVQTPHIGGIVQFFRFVPGAGGDPGRFERGGADSTFSTHSIGSRNLDLGIVTDADGDGRLDVVVPSQDQSTLHVLTRTDDSSATATTEGGVERLFSVDLGARLSSNLAARSVGDDGAVSYAAGTVDGRVIIWPATAG